MTSGTQAVEKSKEDMNTLEGKVSIALPRVDEFPHPRKLKGGILIVAQIVLFFILKKNALSLQLKIVGVREERKN